MKIRVLRGLSLALVSTVVSLAGCGSGDDDDGSNGTGGSSGSGGGTPMGSVADCGRCMQSADCVSGFCNAASAQHGVCTAPGVYDCALTSTQAYRGLSGKALELTGSVPAPEPGAAQSFDADDPNILAFGRIDWTDPKAPRFSAPGVTFKARFEGTSVAVKLSDEFRWGRRDYFDAIIDEGVYLDHSTPLGISMKISPEMGTTYYPVISGLPKGEHTITLVKRTESSIGHADFLGFEFDGPILDKPAVNLKKIQVIGDSINCGVGTDLPKHEGTEDIENTYCKEDNWGVPYHDAHLGFGAVAARYFDAEYQLATVSGIGMVRDYSSNPNDDLRTLPEVYDSLFLDDKASPKWDPKDFVPDAVVIALGTNDFSPGDNPSSSPRERMEIDTFVETYVEFLDKLMSDDYYPDAQFLVLGSPMLGDGYPDETYTYRTDLITAIGELEAHYADKGNVHAVPIAKVFGKGCGRHPSASEQSSTAISELVPALSRIMHW